MENFLSIFIILPLKGEIYWGHRNLVLDFSQISSLI